MKNALLIALALASVSAFAGGKITKEVRAEAKKACQAEGKTKKELKSCVKEKLATHSTEAAK